MRRVLVVSEANDWHLARLAEAAPRFGLALSACTLRDCAFRIDGDGTGLHLPGFSEALPDAVLVRTVGSGTFEQVTLRLSLLHALALLGVPVLNEARAIERCVDKGMTSFLLRRAGIATPPARVTEAQALAEGFRAEAPHDLVVKPLFGSQGRGIKRLSPSDAMPDAAETEGVWYLQHFIGREIDWHDYRVFVIGDRAVAAMIRRGQSWITNVHQGAGCEPASYDGALGAIAVDAARAVGAAYAGVDLMEDAHGVLQVLEVNSMPAWKGLQSVAATDIAERLMGHVAERIG